MAYNSRNSYINMDNPSNSDGSMAKGYPIFVSNYPDHIHYYVVGKSYRIDLVMNDNVVATNSGTVQSGWVDTINGQYGIRFPQINYRISRAHDPMGASFRIVIYIQGINSGLPATIFSNAGDFYTDPTNLSISAKSNYIITYNANGGSNPPTNQTKWYNENLTLSSTRPTRTGYTFKGWATSSSATSASVQPGATYTANSGTAYYAVWQINTHTITYNSNGGSGAPGSTTKNYGQAQTISSTKPTRMNYDFKGWSLSQNGAVQYTSGQTISDYANHTLYAVWEYRTDLPTINNLSIERCEEDGTLSDEGKTALISFDWSAPRKCKQIKITFTGLSNVITTTYTSEEDKKSDRYSNIVCKNLFLMENSYKVTITIDDYDNGETTITGLLTKGADVPIDVYKDGKGVAFGKYAEEENVMDVNFKARYWKGQKMFETINSGNNKRWQYLGQVQINRQGDYAHFKIFGGAGQNAATNQNMLMDIVMKKGFQSESSTTNYVGVTYNIYKMNDDRYNTDNVKVKVLCRTIGYAEVYIYFDWPWSTIRYTIDGVFDDFIRGFGNDLTELPTEGVEQPCIGGVIPILYNGDLTTIRSFRIPKNSNEGAGLCNSDGLSIIRDHNNGCVTVDATNEYLFLGWAHTKGINILNGKAGVESGGKFYSKNGDVAFSHTHSTSGKTIAFGVGSGGDNRGIWDNNYSNWIFGHNNAKTTWINGNFIQLNNNTRVYGYLDVNNNIRTYDGNIWADKGSIWVNTGTIYCNTVDGSGKGCRMNSNGNLTVCGSLYNDYGSMRFKHIYDADINSNAPNMYIQSNGWIRRTSNTSLLAHKKDIKNIQNEELNPERLYKLEVKQYKYKEKYQPSEYDIRYGKDLIGFIAEDVEKIYPIAADYEYDVDHDEDENINDYKKDTVETVKRSLINWNERYLIPPMLKLIQNHKKEIDDLKVKMAALEQRLAALENNN